MNSSAAKAIHDGILGKIFPTAARIPGDTLWAAGPPLGTAGLLGEP
jgi:hypothetical protein